MAMTQSATSRLVTPRFLVLVGMIAFAVATRLVTFYAPNVLPYNFSPVEAIALFGGAYFLDRRVALIVPLGAMFLADLVIGLHDLLPVVYSCIALTTLLGFNLRNRVGPVRVAAYGVVSATLFFVVTNFFVWLLGNMYTHDGAGLVDCYLMAIPFYKNTLIGTLLWSVVLFGGFEALRRSTRALEPVAA
jgi:hypothetical protein